MSYENDHARVGNRTISKVRWGRRGVAASLLIGAGALAVRQFSWLSFSPADEREYEVVAQWQIPPGGKGLIVAVRPDFTLEELRVLGQRLQQKFGRSDNTIVMIFDDAEAAWRVRKGSRVVGEKLFQAALLHQRAMYLKSSARSENSLTIYKSYPRIREVVHFGKSDVRKQTR